MARSSSFARTALLIFAALAPRAGEAAGVASSRSAESHHLSQQSALARQHAPAPAPSTDTRALLAAINQARAAHHVGPLSLDARESVCSTKHSTHMAREGYISHDQFPADICVPYHHIGENAGVAAGTPLGAVLELQRVMMAEGPCPNPACPHGEFDQHGHYLNLIDPAYRHIGIGIVVYGGQTWLTEDFTG